MSRPDRQRLPIGYWLKRADDLLTARIDAAQRENGLTRLDWQALNVVRDAGDADPAQVTAALEPFASALEVEHALDALRQRGLLGESEGTVRLTELGSNVYDRALSSQKTVRTRALDGIHQDAYETTMRVLRQLVENLERDGAA